MTTAQNSIAPALGPNEMGANRLIKLDFTDAQRAAWGSVTSFPKRERYRRADIYAVGGTYTPPAGAGAFIAE